MFGELWYATDPDSSLPRRQRKRMPWRRPYRREIERDKARANGVSCKIQITSQWIKAASVASQLKDKSVLLIFLCVEVLIDIIWSCWRPLSFCFPSGCSGWGFARNRSGRHQPALKLPQDRRSWTYINASLRKTVDGCSAEGRFPHIMWLDGVIFLSSRPNNFIEVGQLGEPVVFVDNSVFRRGQLCAGLAGGGVELGLLEHPQLCALSLLGGFGWACCGWLGSADFWGLHLAVRLERIFAICLCWLGLTCTHQLVYDTQ